MFERSIFWKGQHEVFFLITIYFDDTAKQPKDVRKF